MSFDYPGISKSATALTESEQQLLNSRMFADLNGGNVKRAEDAATSYIRTSMREASFFAQIIPPQKIGKERLMRSLTNDLPMVLDELEVDTPGSTWVPLQTSPKAEYIQGSKFVTPLARIMTPALEKDLDELHTYDTIDLRRVLTDISLKYGQRQIDGKGMALVDEICTAAGTPGVAHPVTGKVQWRRFSGGLTRENFAEAMKMLPTNSTNEPDKDKFGCPNAVCLMNNITAIDFLKYERPEAGGDLSQKLLLNGLSVETLPIHNLKAIFTVKQSLVPTGTIYFFTNPGWLGRYYYLYDWVMYMEKRGPFVSSYSYWMGGISIANIAGVARADFVTA